MNSDVQTFQYFYMGGNCFSQNTKKQKKSNELKYISKEGSYCDAVSGGSHHDSSTIFSNSPSEWNPSTAVFKNESLIDNNNDKFNPQDWSVSLQNNIEPSHSQDEINLWIQAVNAQTKKVRIPRRKKATSSSSPKEQVEQPKKIVEKIQNCRQSQQIEKNQPQQSGQKKVTTSTLLSTMGFMLPRCRAGPIIVPFIDYDNYTLSQ